MRNLYDEAQQALQDGDLGTYADRVEQIGEELEGFDTNTTDAEPTQPTQPIDTPDEDELGGGVPAE
jgi:hypothetical protein